MGNRWIDSWKALSRRLAGQLPVRTPAMMPARAPQNAFPVPVAVEGTSRGWLKVLSAEHLLTHLHAQSALDAIWRQSRLAAPAWERDLLAAIYRHAEFVQLMPASESHHHAHAGGLLAHTLEIVLAAMTWRNGHLLPSGAQIEQIDAERDVWTYTVFFAALLHDIAKPLTDLRIQWRADKMPEPLRWMPLAGSLPQLAQQRRSAEYLVEFAPKSTRDYGAHSRLALTLLGQIAPPTALSFLAGTPQAMDALTQYLSGQDKTTLLARIVSRADQASARKALLTGSRARFETATSVPLIELLMSAIKSMLQSGTALPLNRSGAAGWVHDGSVWFVAKRLADAVRAWIHTHAPDENIPGDSKNDRLFDTWQEYGCIQPNPQTGQAVWYVVVHGDQPDDEAAQTGQGAAAYSHSLTVLRFPLARLYDDPTRYPPAMLGRIEVKDKRPAKDSDAKQAEPEQPEQKIETTHDSQKDDAILAEESSAKPKSGSSGSSGSKDLLRAPSFNKPKSAAIPVKTPKSAAGQPERTPITEITIGGGGVDGFDVDDGLLDEDDDVRVVAAAVKPAATGKAPKHAASVIKQPKKPKTAAWPTPEPVAARSVTDTNQEPEQPRERLIKPLFDNSQAKPDSPTPVVLMPQLPELPQAAATRKAEPSETALAFMQWLQQGLAGRVIKYNEASAPVHFTDEGMALVSPLIFKQYARETGPEAQADINGLQVQREVIKAGWHRMIASKGTGKLNILRYEVIGRGGLPVGKLSAIVLVDPDRWVMPVPPSNPVLKLAA